MVSEREFEGANARKDYEKLVLTSLEDIVKFCIKQVITGKVFVNGRFCCMVDNDCFCPYRNEFVYLNTGVGLMFECVREEKKQDRYLYIGFKGELL